MAIPEHVKRQAMDAVNHKETTAQIRMYRNNEAEDPTSSSSTNAPAPASKARDGVEPAARTAIPEHVKKQAMDAVSHKETTAQIRLVKETGSMSPATPNRDTDRTAERIAQLQKGGHDVDSVHRQMTKDGFGGGRE